MIRWWQDEIEGTGRVPLISTEQKPEVLRFAQGTDADLRLAWQEFLIRIDVYKRQVLELRLPRRHGKTYPSRPMEGEDMW